MNIRRIAAALVAEAMGALIFIMFGCLGCVDSEHFPNTNFQKGLNFGLLVMVLIQLFHAISGAHVNPCVTIAAVIMKQLKWYMGLAYIGVQFAGYALGYLLAIVLGPQSVVRKNNFCTTTPATGIRAGTAFFFEMLLTAGWIYAMCASWDKRNTRFRDALGLRVGFIVAAMSVSGGIFTGASMNPLRTLIPAIFTSTYTHIWVYMVAPLVAAVAVAYEWRFTYGVVYEENKEAAGGDAA